MAKAKSPAASVDDVVRKALMTAADGETRLTADNETPGLFPSAKAPNAVPIKRLRDADPALVLFRKEGKAEFVRLTAAGFDMVLPDLPAERVADVAKQVVADLPARERVDFLEGVVRRVPTAMPGLLAARADASEAARVEAAALAVTAEKRRAAEAATREAMRDWLRLQDEEKKRWVEFLKQQLAAEGEPVQDGEAGSTVRPPVGQKPAPPRPTDADGVDFQRDVAGRLVSSWVDAFDMGKDEPRRFLQTAMENVSGLEPIGEEGGRVAFDNRFHDCPSAVSTGAAVRVGRPGWLLDEGDGRKYVLERAVVTDRGA